MLIKSAALQHWLRHFFGYGSWQAPIWFIAHEDGGGDLPEEVAEKLDYFYQTRLQEEPTLCDLRESYRKFSIHWTSGAKAGMFKTLHDYRFGPQAQVNPIWRNLIAFSHGYQGKPLPDPLEYQRNTFAQSGEALIKLYPLPSPHNHSWYYSWLDLPQFPFLKTREQYEAYVYPSRIRGILQNMRAYRPGLVLMYGMNNINGLKGTVQEFFPGTQFSLAKAIKQQVPQYHRADIQGTKLLITTQIPTLRHNRVETGFDWLKFGESVR